MCRAWRIGTLHLDISRLPGTPSAIQSPIRPEWNLVSWPRRLKRMGKTARIIVAAVLATGAVAGCTGHTSTAHGRLSGILLMEVGPALIGHPNGDTFALPGQVTAIATAGERFTVTVGKSGRFTMQLPPGTYQLAGYSPRVRAYGMRELCAATHPVNITADELTRGIKVVCSAP